MIVKRKARTKIKGMSDAARGGPEYGLLSKREIGKRHGPEEITAKLRQVGVMTGQGTSMVDGVRSGVTEVTYRRWRE
jgi:hypothetical protein